MRQISIITPGGVGDRRASCVTPLFGKVTVNVVPMLCVLSKVIVPPCNSTSRLARANSSPVPCPVLEASISWENP